ncbi:MAG: D-alanyl-D-alanine carboxypeptidase [Clostridia bacterium]|nr:D-alanyl-D-alanine carboxypeptidase [Clostridia bacterium]
MPQRLFALLCAAFFMIACPVLSPRAMAEEEEEERFVAPTLPPDAIPYDDEHPEFLDEDMIYALSAILVEASTGEVIFEKNADEIMYPASTTKILTGYIALQMADLENDIVTVSQNAVDLVPRGYQKIPLNVGEQVPMDDLIAAMLVRSGNEAANAIAEYLGGTISGFASLMNQTAQMLGCSPYTNFSNPSGLHEQTHYTTARDMAIIARAAMQDERFMDIIGRTSYEMDATSGEGSAGGHPRRTVVGNTPILNPESDYYFRSCIGGKTGYTVPAGYCFVGYARRGGIDLIAVVMYSGDTRRWLDTRRLFEYGFTQIESISPESLYAEEPRVIEISGFDPHDANHGELTLGIRAVDESRNMTIIGNKAKIDLLRENFSQISTINWVKEFRAPIEVGEVIGRLTFYAESGETAEYELVATRSIAARENAPLTLEQIEAYTMADENPFPRFTWDLLIPPGALLLLLMMLARFIRRHRKKRPKPPDLQKEKTTRLG